MLTLNVFLTKFPEFEGRVDEEVLEALIEQIELETCQYEGLKTEALQLQAIALRVAFEVENTYPVNALLSGNVKRVKSLNDEVEYAVSNIGSGDYTANQYGQRLMRFLKTNYYGGFHV
jgi:hypothetical protein